MIDIGLWAKAYEEVDIFSWQEAVANMLSVSELEVELAASEGVVRRAIEREQVRPDHSVTLGEGIHHYFARDRVDEVRQVLGLPKVEQHNIKNLFLQYADDRMDMSASYKPVMLLAMLDCVDERGARNLRMWSPGSGGFTRLAKKLGSWSKGQMRGWQSLTACRMPMLGE